MKTSQKPVSLWRNRDYLLLWSGQLVSAVGSGVSQLAYPLLALAITHSPAQAGIVGAIGSLAYVLFILPAGAFLDRWDRKRVMIYCDTGRALCLGSVVLAALLGDLSIVQLYIVSFLSWSFGVFFDIAQLVCLPQVVSKEQLPDALGLWQASEGVLNLLGPPLGGTLFAIRAFFPFLFDAVSYSASIVSLLFICVPFQEEREAKPHNLRVEIFEGTHWLWHQPLLRAMALLTSGSMFFGAGSSLISIVIAQQYHASSAFIGLIFSAYGLGGILGAALAGRVQKRFSFAQIIVGILWLYALFWFPLISLPPPFWLAVINFLLAFIGSLYVVAHVGRRLAMAPDALQSRINSASRLIILGTVPVGQAITGLLLQYTTTRFTVIVLVIGQAILAMVAMFIPAIRRENTRML
jgi:predicted MFS family arabinose efflux permease